MIVSSAVDVTNCRLDLADYSVTRFSSKTPEVYAHELLLPSIQESWVKKIKKAMYMVFVLWFREGKLLWPIFNKREQRFL